MCIRDSQPDQPHQGRHPGRHRRLRGLDELVVRGEGTGISLTAAKQSPGFKAQNNTLAVYVNAHEIAKFAARLDYEHSVAASQPQPDPAAAPTT